MAILGLGYVGCVTAACLSRDRHHIVGVDINREKMETIRRGQSPVIEPGLAALIRNGVENGRLEVTSDVAQAVERSEAVLVCVGTPSKENGDLDLRFIQRVCQEVGCALREKRDYTVVVVRSTMLPGSAAGSLIPVLESASGKQAGDRYGLCVNPEFLREGSAIYDFDNPPFTVIGEVDEKSGETLLPLFLSVDAPIFRVPLGVAEMVKLASNAFHGLKVAFANEIGNFCQTYGVDSHTVMDILVRDTKLTLSPYYLKPGFAFGGSCLPKDLRALSYAARRGDVKMPVMEAVLPSNHMQVQKALDIVLQEGKRKVGIIGLSFKPRTDDLRESPMIELAERLLGKGFEVLIWDREVSLSKLHGSNLAYIEQVLPHISSLMRSSLTETLNQAETVVIGKKPEERDYRDLIGALRPEHTVIDLVRLSNNGLVKAGCGYRGICW